MVLYFSATGNTQHIAQLIADKLADQTTDLLGRLRAGDHSAIHSDSPFVICLPVYVGDIPCFIMECLNSTPLKGSGKIYFVYTCAGYTSSGFRHAKKIAGTKGMEYGGSLSVQMPNNYVASNLNGIPDDAEIKELIAAAEPVTDEIAATIRRGGTLKSRHITLAEHVLCIFTYWFWRTFMQRTKPFYATKNCTGCGLCEKKCPLGIIKMTDSHPVWTGSKCAHCMACIQNCPAGAIEYGSKTQEKKRYTFKGSVQSP